MFSNINLQLQDFLLVINMLDCSIMRRRQPCWNHAPNVAMIAVNNPFKLESVRRHLLKACFRMESQVGFGWRTSQFPANSISS